MGRLAPPSVVSAMVGDEHISAFGDNRVYFSSFLVVLTLLGPVVSKALSLNGG